MSTSPTPRPCATFESNSVPWQTVSIHQRFISPRNKALTTLLPSVIVTTLPTFAPSTRGRSISNALLIAPQLLKISLNILRRNRLTTVRERLEEVLDFVFEVVVYHYALCQINPLALTASLHKDSLLITYR